MKVSIFEQQCWIDDYTVVPNVWILLKNYHDAYGTTKDVEWASNDDVADLYGFSCYSWNENYMLKIAKRIKENNPKALIVFGGPQPDYKRGYLMMHSFIDCIVPADGEEPFSNIVDGMPLDVIDGVVTRTSTNQVRPMFKEWPGSAILDNEEYIFDTIAATKEAGGLATYIYESTRGCPYKCVYCDWGGGTYTKLRRKPLELIKEELGALAVAGLDLLRFQDGNFGILERDVEIAEFIVECKERFGFPKTVHVNWAKNNKERVRDIMRIFYKAEMIFFYKISLQDLDGDVGKAIKRKDVAWDEQLRIGNELKAELGMPIKIEIILGLPGQTKENFFHEYGQMMDAGVEVPAPYLCLVLPNTELAEEGYMAEWGVETANVMQGQYPFKEMDDSTTHVVVATDLMSRTDWVDMLLFSNLTVALENGGIFSEFVTNKYDYSTIWYELFNNTDDYPFATHIVENARKHVLYHMDNPVDSLTNIRPINCPTTLQLALDCYFHASMLHNPGFAAEVYYYKGWTIKTTPCGDVERQYKNGLVTITNKDYGN